MDWSMFAVKLVRHIGAQIKEPFGLLPVEHNQKRVFVQGPNYDKWIDCGYLPDNGAAVLWNPYTRDACKDTKGLCEHIESEALRLREAGTFEDPDPASYFYAGQKQPEA